MAITIPVLILLVAFFAVPNYLAIRYALFGGSGATATAAAGGPTVAVAAAPVAAGRRLAGGNWASRGFGWKALSPILFSLGVILSIAVGGVAGIAIISVATLNLIWGFLGWNGHYVNNRRY